MEHNECGEIPHHGPAWACRRFGQAGHDYQSCPVCRSRFEMYLAAKGDIHAAGLVTAA